MSTTQKSTWRRTTRMAAVAATGALLLSGCEFSVYNLPLPGGADVGDNPYEVVVEFRDVLDLVPQSTVKVDDVSVGRVEDVELDGYTARVTLTLHEDVELPANAEAKIRQTSLLGEKFVSLEEPSSSPSSDMLGDGDVIRLERSGRNTEVEEVLGALSLVLNGGGVAQLKTISKELTAVFEGREGTVKSVLEEIRVLMSQLDGSRNQIVRALEQVNSLAISLNDETDTLDLALEELPASIASVDRQRDDLVTMLQALTELSAVGTRVIQQSKADTIKSLEALAPTLTELADSGDDLVNSFQVGLTFPFVDASVGNNAQQARDLHIGDYTNLSLNVDLNLEDILLNGVGLPNGPTIQLCTLIPEPRVGQLCQLATGEIIEITGEILNLLLQGDLDLTELPIIGGGDNGGRNGGLFGGRGGDGGLFGGRGGDGGLLGGLTGGLNRAPLGSASDPSSPGGGRAHDVDTDLAAMLVWGVMKR